MFVEALNRARCFFSRLFSCVLIGVFCYETLVFFYFCQFHRQVGERPETNQSARKWPYFAPIPGTIKHYQVPGTIKREGRKNG